MTEELVTDKRQEIPLLESMKIECETAIENAYEALRTKESIVVMQVKLAKSIRTLQAFEARLRAWMKN